MNNRIPLFVCLFNASPTGQIGCRLANDIFRYTLMNEKFCILIQISPKFVLKD